MGNAFLETCWTILATLKKIGTINTFDFFKQAILAYESNQPLPSLVNIGGFVDPKYIEESNNDLDKISENDKERTKTRKAEKIAKIEAKKSNENSSTTEKKTEKKSKRKPKTKEWDPFSHHSGKSSGSGSAENPQAPEPTIPPPTEAPSDQSSAGEVSGGGVGGDKSPPLSPKELASRKELIEAIRNALANASKSNAQPRASKRPSEACAGAQPVTSPSSPKSARHRIKAPGPSLGSGACPRRVSSQSL
jgi:hypothetical protein